MALRIAINGFGRIGRLAFRAILERSEPDIDVICINDLGPTESNAHLLKYDSVHGILPFEVGVKENHFEFHNLGAVMPRLYTLVYALSIATSGKASTILLAGFDGYGSNDKRTKILDELFHLYSSSKYAKPIVAVTPTSYRVASSSIYAL